MRNFSRVFLEIRFFIIIIFDQICAFEEDV